MGIKTRKFRARTIARLSSLTLWLVVTIAWIASTRWGFSFFGGSLQPPVTVIAKQPSSSAAKPHEKTWTVLRSVSIRRGYVLYVPEDPVPIEFEYTCEVLDSRPAYGATYSIAQRFGLFLPKRHRNPGGYFPGHRPWMRIFIPLWLFWLPMTTVTALLWLRRRIDRAEGSKPVCPRLGRAASLAIAAVAAAPTISIVPPVIDSLLEGVFGVHYLANSSIPDWAALIIALFIWIAPAFVVGKVIYTQARWRRAWELVPRCEQCGYNLTGNTTGICPECGHKIEPAAPV